MSKKKQKKQRILQQVVDKSPNNVEKFSNTSGKHVDNSPQNVDKTSQIVENTINSCGKNVQNPADTCAKPVDNHSKSCGEPVQNPVENSRSSVQNQSQAVDNSDKTVQNSEIIVEKAVENSVDNSANHNSTNPDASDSANDAPTSSPTVILDTDQVSTQNTEVTDGPTCNAFTSSNEIAIKVTDLHKSFRLPTERAAGLKQAIFNWLKGIKGYTEHKVLRGVSFEVKKGEFIGIVGRNGSGKSTLLKLLAQIYYPEQGNIEVNGVLVPFIELGVGFNPELTGRENVYLNGALLGFSRKEMAAMYDEIVQFAELEQFMDAKLKNYSSGMQVRLAFSIAIRARGDILILDEVLAVGDAAFQQKCNDYFASLHGEQTVILVTHSMENVRQFCDRAILIENGEVAAEGKPDEVAKAYEALWD